MGKKWWKSRSLWFNIGSAVVGAIVAQVTPNNGFPEAVVLAVNVVGNAVLRFLTSQPITK